MVTLEEMLSQVMLLALVVVRRLVTDNLVHGVVVTLPRPVVDPAVVEVTLPAEVAVAPVVAFTFAVVVCRGESEVLVVLLRMRVAPPTLLAVRVAVRGVVRVRGLHREEGREGLNCTVQLCKGAIQ